MRISRESSIITLIYPQPKTTILTKYFYHQQDSTPQALNTYFTSFDAYIFLTLLEDVNRRFSARIWNHNPSSYWPEMVFFEISRDCPCSVMSTRIPGWFVHVQEMTTLSQVPPVKQQLQDTIDWKRHPEFSDVNIGRKEGNLRLMH